MATILNSDHLEFGHLGFSHLSFSFQTHSYLPRLVPTICTKKPSLTFPPHHLYKKKPSLIHSDLTWWWWPSWILPFWIQTLSSWIQTPCYLLSDSLKNTLPPLWLWLKLIQSDSNSFILTQLDDGNHLEFCHLEFGHLGISHLSFSSQTHSYLPRLVPTICTKNLHSFTSHELDDCNHLEFSQLGFSHLAQNTSLIHSDSTWWWQPSWILPSWIQTLSWLDSDTLLSSLHDSLKNTLPPLWLWLKLIHIENFKLIHSHSTWWWQPSWILPSWIQLVHCGIQTPCFLLSDSLKNTLPPLWLWLKQIQSDSNSFILNQLDEWQPSWILSSWIWLSWNQPS